MVSFTCMGSRKKIMTWILYVTWYLPGSQWEKNHHISWLFYSVGTFFNFPYPHLQCLSITSPCGIHVNILPQAMPAMPMPGVPAVCVLKFWWKSLHTRSHSAKQANLQTFGGLHVFMGQIWSLLIYCMVLWLSERWFVVFVVWLNFGIMHLCVSTGRLCVFIIM